MTAPGILTTPFGGWFARTRPTVLIIDCTRPLSTSGSVLRPLRAVASPAATPRSGCCRCATPIARAPRQPRSGQVPGVGESGASPLLRHPGRNAVPPEVLTEKREAMASALRNLTKVAIPVSSNIATGRAGEREPLRPERCLSGSGGHPCVVCEPGSPMRKWLRGLPVLAKDSECCPQGLRRCAEALLPGASPDVPSATGQAWTVTTPWRDLPCRSLTMHARIAERPRPLPARGRSDRSGEYRGAGPVTFELVQYLLAPPH